MIASFPSWPEVREEFLAWEARYFPLAAEPPSSPPSPPPAEKSEEELEAEEKALADAALDAEAASRVSELIASQGGDDNNGDADASHEEKSRSRDFDLYSNAALVGHDPTPRIVAIEFSDPNHITEYHRRPDGSTRAKKTTFKPFIWEQRDGSALRLQFFTLWSSFRQYARYGAQTQCAIRDPIQQYLTITGRTLFKGMRFEELRRMQLDIETACAPGFEFPSAERDQIIAIALSDSTGWEKLILIEAGSRKSEAAALKRLTSLIIQRDPDIIEGHNLFKFDLPYMMARAKELGVELTWGRDGSKLFQERKWRDDPGLAKISVGGQYIDFPNLRVRGRHIVDTFLLAQAYDANARSLPSYGLKAVAAALGVQEPDRVILDAEGIQRAYLEDRASFTAYALGDVRETRSVSAILSQSYFLAAQIYPLGGYQNVLMAGEARRTNSLLLRAYYRAGCPIPRAPKHREYRGALCEVHKRGVIKDVWHCDIASLYPTTMLLFDCLPKSDALGVIKTILTDLRDYRLAAKRAAESATNNPIEKTRWDALQGTFKIAINAIYGYLGTPGGNFADFDAAEMVTAIGRCLMARMRDWLAACGATIIEIDTDGIFFSPPAGASEGADLEELKRGLSAQLPRGMILNFDRHYAAMFSYKSKNCALLADDGKIMVKGGSLRSRALEPFLRRYQTTVLQLLLAGREAEVPKLYDDTLWALQHHEFPLEELAESKTLRKSLEEYELKLNNGGNPMAQYEVATSSEQEYLRGDKVLFYYIAGPEEKRGSRYKHAKSLPRGATPERDEDVELYIKKLNQVAKRFDEFASGRIPWRPERKRRKKNKNETPTPMPDNL